MTNASLAVLRAHAQLLHRPAGHSPTDVVRTLLAVQAQDLRWARLALRARATAARSEDLDHALSEDRSLVVGWLGRGTLHLVAVEDYAWLHALTAPTHTATNRRRLAEEGVRPEDADRTVPGGARPGDACGPLALVRPALA